MAGRNFLFIPGPTNVPDRVQSAMLGAMVSGWRRLIAPAMVAVAATTPRCPLLRSCKSAIVWLNELSAWRTQFLPVRSSWACSASKSEPIAWAMFCATPIIRRSPVVHVRLVEDVAL